MTGIVLEWDVYQEQCPSRFVFDRIANKWTLLLLGMLEGSPARFNQLHRALEGISRKSLTQTLRTLERDGLVERKVLAASPIAVEYSITPLGRTLAGAAEALRTWSEAHMKEVLAAQETFDST